MHGRVRIDVMTVDRHGHWTMNGDMMNGPGGWAWLMLVVMMLVAAAVVVVVVVVLRSTRPVPVAGLGPTRATGILDERFAAGEIDEDEYRRRRGVLDDA